MNHKNDVSKTIMNALIDLMVSGEFPPQSKLPSERDLAQTWQVSRASIREVMSALSLIGLVETRHGGGNYVGNFQVTSFIQSLSRLIEANARAKDLWGVRRMLETEAIHLIIARDDLEEVKQVFQEILNGMKEAIQLEDNALGDLYDTKFHNALFSFAGNDILRLFADGIQEILRNLVSYNRVVILSQQQNALVLYQQHEAIMDAIIHREEEKAIFLLKQHLDFVLLFQEKEVKDTI